MRPGEYRCGKNAQYECWLLSGPRHFTRQIVTHSGQRATVRVHQPPAVSSARTQAQFALPDSQQASRFHNRIPVRKALMFLPQCVSSRTPRCMGHAQRQRGAARTAVVGFDSLRTPSPCATGARRPVSGGRAVIKSIVSPFFAPFTGQVYTTGLCHNQQLSATSQQPFFGGRHDTAA